MQRRRTSARFLLYILCYSHLIVTFIKTDVHVTLGRLSSRVIRATWWGFMRLYGDKIQQKPLKDKPLYTKWVNLYILHYQIGSNAALWTRCEVLLMSYTIGHDFCRFSGFMLICLLWILTGAVFESASKSERICKWTCEWLTDGEIINLLCAKHLWIIIYQSAKQLFITMCYGKYYDKY
jgi:hypothetical protein